MQAAFRLKLAGYDVPDEMMGPVSGGAGQGVVPETVTRGSAAWQRALEMSARRRRN